jgi:tetratricopeptide (TPR) repeat protein
MRYGLLFMLFLLTGPGTALGGQIVDSVGQSVDPAVDQQVSDARLLRMPNMPDQYDPKRSVEMLQQIVAQHPDYYRARYNLALSQLELDPDHPDVYLPTFDQAVKIQLANPSIKDGSIFNTVGWLRLNMRDYDQAQDLFGHALTLAPNNTVWTNSATNYNLGRLYFERSDYTNSLKYLDVAADTYHNPAAISLRQVVKETIDPMPPSPLPPKSP